jgi:NADP-dependent 3-hydroxy acid dehydrogenase YdfG
MMSQFTDKVVIVTGAGTGIGQQVARDFVNAGAKVAFIGRRIEKLQDAAKDLPDKMVMLCSCDVSDRDAVNSTAESIISAWGTVDILVNNAGINTNPRSVGEVAPSGWDRVLNINLTGTFNVIRTVLPRMREQQDGIIVNIASTAGLRAGKLAGAAYSASKHGMVALTHNINEEEWENGIRATAICPGEVNTPLLDKRTVPVSAEHKARMVPPKDVATSVLFVAGLSQYTNVPILVIKPTYQKYS